MSDADHFSVKELNPYSHDEIQPDRQAAKDDHARVKSALQDAGIEVIQAKSPHSCQDGVYTANWAFCTRDVAVLSRLPNIRRGEEGYAQRILRQMGKKILKPTCSRFSGQGDALVCGDTLFLGKQYRTDPEMEDFMKDTFDYNIVSVQTIPQTGEDNLPVINKVSGWPDSFFYDINLAMGVLKPGMIAWCPEAFTPESQKVIAGLTDIEKIEIDHDEAIYGFAANFVSTGHEVIMGSGAPKLQSALHKRGFATTTLEIPELTKGGGFIRHIALTLDND